MQLESVAVLRWIPSDVAGLGQAAVETVLEQALAGTLRSHGLRSSGRMRTSQASATSYPHAADGRPTHDPYAVLYHAEIDIG